MSYAFPFAHDHDRSYNWEQYHAHSSTDVLIAGLLTKNLERTNPGMAAVKCMADALPLCAGHGEVSSTMRTTLFSSGSFFSLAKKACERSKIDASESIGALIFSAMSVEVLLNEIVESASSPTWSEDQPEEVNMFAVVLGDLERRHAQIDLKIQIGYYILTRKRLDKGSLLYQDFDLLMDIRNALAHKKPEKVELLLAVPIPDRRYDPHKFIKRLADRKVIPLPPAYAPPNWQAYVSCPEVADWSYRTALQMAELLVNLFPNGRLGEMLRIAQETILPDP